MGERPAVQREIKKKIHNTIKMKSAARSEESETLKTLNPKIGFRKLVWCW